MRLLIIVPTYNEIENIESLLADIFSKSSDAHVLVVDDNSPDGTSAVVEKIAERNSSVFLLRRSVKQGVASAFLEGFSWGISNDYELFLAMDADFSHDPKYIPALLKAVEHSDLVIGSRIVSGGGVKNRSFIRNFLTKASSVYCKIILNCPIKDFTGGYNLWRKSTLEKIGIESVFSRGYSFQIEMKYKAYKHKCSIVEIPIIFQDRIKGTSKMPAAYLFKALIDVFKIRKLVK